MNWSEVAPNGTAAGWEQVVSLLPKFRVKDGSDQFRWLERIS